MDGASRGCWAALWYRCSSRPWPLSWVMWALWSGSWSDADVSKRAAQGSATFSTAHRESARGSSSSSAWHLTSQCHHRHHHHHHHHAKRTTAAAVCHPEIDPGKAGHIAWLVGTSERTSSSSSSSSAHSSRGAEQEEEKDPTSIPPPGLVDDHVYQFTYSFPLLSRKFGKIKKWFNAFNYFFVFDTSCILWYFCANVYFMYMELGSMWVVVDLCCCWQPSRKIKDNKTTHMNRDIDIYVEECKLKKYLLNVGHLSRPQCVDFCVSRVCYKILILTYSHL